MVKIDCNKLASALGKSARKVMVKRVNGITKDKKIRKELMKFNPIYVI